MPEIRLREALAADVPAIVALLADDGLGAGREDLSEAARPAYLAAFAEIAEDPRNLLAVAEDAQGQVIGTLQLTFLPGLSNQGAGLMLVRAVRVASTLRGSGLGARMMQWAMDEGRLRGCKAVELFTHNSRIDAQRFYEKLGFQKTHAGMRRSL